MHYKQVCFVEKVHIYTAPISEESQQQRFQVGYGLDVLFSCTGFNFSLQSSVSQSL